jgi:hypothetical protein
MAESRPRSSGVTAAATYVLLCAFTGLLYWGYLVLTMLNAPGDDQGRSFFDVNPGTFLLVAALPPALIAAAVRIAIGLLQLRPWSRIVSMISAGLLVTLCLGLVAFRPFQTFVIPQHFVHQAVLTRQLLAVSAVVTLLPVSVWWLFYFRMQSVKRQFQAEEPLAS